MHSIIFSTPLGDLIAIASETHLVMLEFADSKQLEKKLSFFGCVIPTKEESIKDNTKQMSHTSVGQDENNILIHTQVQLGEYFEGRRKSFTIPLVPSGTDFQKQAWKALEKIPYGETRSYQEEATLVGNPKSVRAIGGANNKNPIVIIIPCHRVIGKGGKLVGYGGGIERKIWLLDHEKKHI